ncbi:pleiotropic drug resistance protein, ABC superfamily [Microthyrium microscopicum]|uniref:Pleiotropic drug resistance protein, ABC superfamily n=1 Tax=Microthyrium microscopicum TaxID=703497 RepID=A0A6A6TUD0_9PEZI|nr:pleiotropic drug resistance protein, ABC superfamily [Microthyrium microscopicum]
METRSQNEPAPPGILMRAVSPVDVAVRNVSVTAGTSSRGPSIFQTIRSRKVLQEDEESGTTSRPLLNNVSAYMPQGSLTAIIGASGSGKTTLLNVLAQRLDESTMEISGSTTFNGVSQLSSQYAYVMQDDCLIPSLTVRETLQYSGELRLDDVLSAKERSLIVEQTISELSLKECASTRVGTSSAKGCSGGEKRRTSIGIQLLQNPSVLFADEVTSGLDATSAHQVVQTLKDFAKRGRTIVMTIHQPRSEIWDLFDRVVVLAHGSCVYSGEAERCLPYFKSIGFEAPPFVNPAEFLIDLAAIDNRTPEKERIDLIRFDRLRTSWAKHNDEVTDARTTSANLSVATRSSKVSTWRQFRIMTRRSMLVSFRDPKGLLGTIAEAVAVAFILGWAFYKLDDNLQGIRSRQGAFFTAAAVQGYLMLVYEIHRCTEDLPIFDREHSEGVVHVLPYLLSRRAAKAIEDILMSFLYSVIFYFMVGLRPGTEHFFIFFATVLLIQLTAVSVAMFSVSIFRDFPSAAMIGFAVFGYSNFSGGCFIPANKIPPYVGWVKWISYIFYAYGALMNNEFSGRIFSCDKPEGVTSFHCEQFSGAYQLRVSGVSLSISQGLVALAGLVGGFNVAIGLVLYFFPVKIRMSKKPQVDFKPTIHVEREGQSWSEKRQEAVISLMQYSLDVQKRRPWGAIHNQISILKPLSTTFQPGKLNIIMGPSGSGKTSLLSSLADRLRNSMLTSYKTQGEIMVNGHVATNSRLGSMISLVTQDDDGLLPSLTVRETLRFAAALRLHDLSVDAKHQKAEEILLRMGLKDCANTLIGNNMIKGVSGGEKRRVTIAIQLLTDPKVLLLDEPTSGLDGYTAQNIIELLTELAAEGRTVVLTIHQNRSDLFATNVLLLARGGQVGYCGPGKDMLPHFRDAGYECSEQTNPGDFVLDLITVDLRDDRREVESKKRVERLLSIWSAKEKEHSDKKSASAEVWSISDDAKVFVKSPASFTIAFPILFHRSALNLWREKNAMIARIMNVVPYGLLIALFFAPLHTDYQAILTRLGLIQLVCFMYFMGTLNNAAHFPIEKPVMNQEVEERAYTVVPFFVSFSLLELPFTLVASCLAAVVAAFPIGVRSAEVYFAMFFNIFAMLSCGESLALALNSVLSDSGLTLSVTNVLICIAQTMAGVLSINMPKFLRDINRISPITYVAGNLAPYFFRGVVFDCSPEKKLPGESCIQTKGDDILQLYGLDHNPRVQLAILAGVMLGYRLFAFVVLYLRKRTWK